MSGSSSARA
ncbi:UNVERIFIED_CONTAM: hypothetical protein GTU68_015974 [Idotea baltica]|nr:hypothetical protein [Idotea baltica]